MSRYETDINAYVGVTAASAMVGAAAVFAATSGSINRAIMIARTNAVRRLIADRIRRTRASHRQLERDLAFAKCDAALARWHLAKLARKLPRDLRR